MEILLKVDQISKHFGGFTALNGVSLALKKGEPSGSLAQMALERLRLLTVFRAPFLMKAVKSHFVDSPLHACPRINGPGLVLPAAFRFLGPFAA